MNYLDRASVIYQMDRSTPPVCLVESGNIITVHTYDCFKGKLPPASSLPGDACSDELNPATGPIYVNGTQPGDTLKIEILKIELDKTGMTAIDKSFGCLAPKVKEAQAKRLPIEKGRAKFSEVLTVRLNPMIGVIGVAPAGEPIPTDTPDIHGGNMDCTQIKEGASLYLPVLVEGALLSLGDLHACMGDGEIGGCGVEIAGEVTLRLFVIRDWQKKYPVVVTEDKVNVIASKPTVEEAWKEAVHLMHSYLSEETHLTCDDAVMLMSIAADLSICQTVNPNKTVRMSISRYCLDAYGWHMK